MCGIFGYVLNKNQNLKDQKIINSLRNRGPDHQSIKKIEVNNTQQLTLIHTRLSIIDLSKNAHQPLFDENTGCHIIYNGEIYNYRELRNVLITRGYRFKSNSDTEVILKAYIEWHEECLEKLRGMFAFCIYDPRNKKLLLARDIFGMKPLYYIQNGNNFLFSSLLKSILVSGYKEKYHLNKQALRDYLVIGSFIPPETILENTRVLLPGYYIIYKNGKLYENSYLRVDDLFIENKMISSKEDSLRLVKEKLVESVDKHFIADVEVGILLSAGVDSTLITAISSKILNKKVRTFTIGYYDDKYSRIDESKLATDSSKHYNTIHKSFKVNFDEFKTYFESFIDAIDVPSYDGFNTFLVTQKISKKVKVVLSGLGGDEMFAGYQVFKELYFLKNVNLFNRLLVKFPYLVLKKIGKSYLKNINKSTRDILISKRLMNDFGETTKEKLLNNFVVKNNLLNTISIFEIKNYMSNTLLRDSDAVSMYNSLEIRMPFVDKEIVKTIARIPDRYKIDINMNKILLIDSFRDILPKTITNRKKTGFMLPIPDWSNKLIKEKGQTFNFINLILGEENLKLSESRNEYENFKLIMLESWIMKNMDFIYV